MDWQAVFCCILGPCVGAGTGDPGSEDNSLEIKAFAKDVRKMHKKNSGGCKINPSKKT
jgi:hypothetical protein